MANPSEIRDPFLTRLFAESVQTISPGDFLPPLLERLERQYRLQQVTRTIALGVALIVAGLCAFLLTGLAESAAVATGDAWTALVSWSPTWGFLLMWAAVFLLLVVLLPWALVWRSWRA